MTRFLLRAGMEVAVKGDPDELVDRITGALARASSGGSNQPSAGVAGTAITTWWVNEARALIRFESLDGRLPVYLDPLEIVAVLP